MSFGPKKKELNPRHAKFAAEWVRTGNGKAAAIACSYPERTAARMANKLLKLPLVKAEVDRLRAAVTESGKYNYQKAMAECEEAMAFAKQTENANAFTKAVELRAKLTGLLVEKVDLRAAAGFQLILSGLNLPNIQVGARNVEGAAVPQIAQIETEKEIKP